MVKLRICYDDGEYNQTIIIDFGYIESIKELEVIEGEEQKTQWIEHKRVKNK